MCLQDLGFDATIHDQVDKDRALRPFVADVVGRFKGSASKADAAHRKRIVYVECQNVIDGEWTEKITKNYDGLNVIVLKIQKFNVPVIGSCWSADVIGILYDEIYKQIDNETLTADKPRTAAKARVPCPDCGEMRTDPKRCAYNDRKKRAASLIVKRTGDETNDR
jgi:hypothetical protein